MKTTKEMPTTLNEILFDVELKDNPRATNSEYAKVVTGYGLFTVPTPLLDNDGNEVIEKKKVKMTTKKVGELDLNYCSDYYELVPNEKIFPAIRQTLINKNIEFTESYSHIDHARFYANYVITDQRYSYNVGGTGDMIQPVLNVQHSYNGMTKYKIQFGYYRLICSNGLIIPVEEMSAYNLSIVGKHTESILKSLIKLNNTLTYFVNHADQITLAITAKYETLAGNWVENWNDRVIEVLNTNKISITVGMKNTIAHITDTITFEAKKYNKGKVNDWLIYNAIKRYIYDDQMNVKSPEIRNDLDSKVFESMLS